MESKALSDNDKKQIAEELKQLLKDSSGHLDDISQRVNQLEEKVGRYSERVEELPSFIRKTNEVWAFYRSGIYCTPPLTVPSYEFVSTILTGKLCHSSKHKQSFFRTMKQSNFPSEWPMKSPHKSTSKAQR